MYFSNSTACSRVICNDFFQVVPVSPPTQTPFAPAPFTSASLNSVVLKKTIPSDGPKRGPNFDSNNLQAELRQRVSAQKQRNFVLPKKNGEFNLIAASYILSCESHYQVHRHHWLSTVHQARIVFVSGFSHSASRTSPCPV